MQCPQWADAGQTEMGNRISLVGAQWSWGCVHVDSVSLVLPSLCVIPASPLRSRNTRPLFWCSYFAFRTRLPVSFCFISGAFGLSYSFTFHCEPLWPPRNTDDQPLFVLNHSSDHNLYATGIKGILKAFMCISVGHRFIAQWKFLKPHS